MTMLDQYRTQLCKMHNFVFRYTVVVWLINLFDVCFSVLIAGVGIGAVTLDDDLREFTTHVTAGGSVELKCNIEGASQLVWKRNGAPINEITGDDIKVTFTFLT